MLIQPLVHLPGDLAENAGPFEDGRGADLHRRGPYHEHLDGVDAAGDAPHPEDGQIDGAGDVEDAP